MMISNWEHSRHCSQQENTHNNFYIQQCITYGWETLKRMHMYNVWEAQHFVPNFKLKFRIVVNTHTHRLISYQHSDLKRIIEGLFTPFKWTEVLACMQPKNSIIHMDIQDCMHTQSNNKIKRISSHGKTTTMYELPHIRTLAEIAAINTKLIKWSTKCY